MRNGFSRQLLTAAVLSVLLPVWAAAHDNLPIFDAHVHYKEPAWGPYPPSTVIELFDRSGVAMALVSSTPDEGTIRLWQFAPGRVVPELRPYHGEWGSGNWQDAPHMLEYLRQRLDDWPHRGIGEFHIHQISTADRELLAAVARLAVEREIPIHLHSGPEPVDLFYELEPGLTVIRAHTGLGETTATIMDTMSRHPTLHADTSLREYGIMQGDEIDPDWKSILTRFQDRLMVGSDTWINGQWANYEQIIADHRTYLNKLPREIAEKIAYRNAERLYGIKVHMGLIGTK
ncbi:MAG: amidohydrolase family protein [Minwuia sp.]|uniref:amidohydrolase family protein n=1 Tax=Minwuia sp. TaxID=2493630 RepID=UPI003A856F84